jgi:hypothetical protein
MITTYPCKNSSIVSLLFVEDFLRHMQQWQSKLDKNLSFRKKSKLFLSSGRRVVSGSSILMQKIHLQIKKQTKS